MLFNSSGVISGRSIICSDSDGSFLLLDTEPDITVRLPSALDKVSAEVLCGANPPKIVSWVLSTIWSEQIAGEEYLVYIGYA